MDLVVRNARLSSAPEATPVDIGVAGGKIVAVQPGLRAEAPSYDAEGHLTCAGLVETHIHLEKSRIVDRCAPETGRQPMAMERVSAVKHTFTVEDAYHRAATTLEGCIKFGATRMRPHVELDGGVELRTFEAVSALKRDYAWAIDIELCVFPQEGLTNNKRSDELLVEALKRGARVIGAAPNFDPDHAGQIHRVFELAREFDVAIDMHLDSGNSSDDLDIHLVCDLTEQYKMGGRVAIGHGCKYSTMKADAFHKLARRIADAGVAVTSLPATDLFMMGRDQTDNVRRGVVDVNALVEIGVNCSISTNNVLNPFTPAWRWCVDPNGQSAGQCLPDRPRPTPARIVLHADGTFRSVDESEGLRDRRRQSRGHRGDRRDNPRTGGGGKRRAAGCLQTRCAYRDKDARRTAPSRLT